MTIDEKVEAYRMKLCGATYQEIADKFGLTKQRIHQILPKESKLNQSTDSCIYIGISNWMAENKCGYSGLAKKLSVSPQSVNLGLRRKTNPSKKLIDKILDLTGLTYEEAFKKK